MTLHKIDPTDRKVKKILKDACTQADGLEYVLVLGMKKEGGLWLRSCEISPMERRWLSGFLSSYCNAEDFPQDNFIKV